MKVVFAAAGALALTVTLVGCGDSSRPQVDPDVAGKPTWAGCQERVDQMIDYAADARGAKTRAAALAPYRKQGDHVTVKPRHAHTNRQWLLVDDANVIHTALEMWRGEHGWLVSRVEKCSG